MSDRMEDFIRKNKNEFNSFEPPVDLWERIDKQLQEQQLKQIRRIKISKRNYFFKIAASVIFIVAAGIALWQYQNNEQSDLVGISPELAKQQMHYASLIDEKQNELQVIKTEDPKLYQEFSAELQKIENNYKKLQSDLPTSPNQEVTVKAMIRNLQIQIQVLNQQLNVIKQIDQFKKEQRYETQHI